MCGGSLRADYDAYYVDVACEFVTATGARLRWLDPGVQAELSVSESIGRINRDSGFSPNRRPYPDHSWLVDAFA